MKLDTPFTPTVADFLSIECEEVEAERQEQRAAATLGENLAAAKIREVEQLLDGQMMRRVVLLTPERMREMNALERRTMLDWIAGRVAMLDQKAALLGRHLLSVPDLPERLRSHG